MRFVERKDLSTWQQDLLAVAERASQTANCPYSEFPVGSAIRVRTRSGEEVTVWGNNSETANYRSVCAEKHAVHRALADYSWTEDGELIRPEILSVAVYCAVGASPQQPCGDCRQTLHEINPDVEVLAAAGPGRDDDAHDQRVTITTVRALLPHGFQAESLRSELQRKPPEIHDSEVLEEQVLHLPRPGDLKTDAEARAALLPGVRYLILVGSPRRARKIAELAHAELGALRSAAECCYCDLTVSGRDETGREYAVYVPELPAAAGGPGTRVAVVSHGIGKAGVEIVLSELPALLALAQGGELPDLRGAIRCGTRGTLSQVPLGSIALSTSTVNEDIEQVTPSAAWIERLRRAATARGMTVVGEAEIDRRGENDWPEGPRTLVEGRGISTSFFWEGQSRPLFRLRADRDDDVRALERRRRATRLALWVRNGVRWIEMEDYTVLRIAEQCGIPAASLGAVLGHRQRADGSFQADYSKQALATSELIPAELALEAIRADATEQS